MSSESLVKSPASDPTSTQRNIVQFWIFMVLIALGAVSVCVAFSMGWVLGLILMLTVVGILLPGLMIITPLKKENAEWLTLGGIILAASGYLAGLNGYFHPVEQLNLKTLQTFDVKAAPGSCRYDPAKSVLTCDVSVTPK